MTISINTISYNSRLIQSKINRNTPEDYTETSVHFRVSVAIYVYPKIPDSHFIKSRV